MSLTLKAPELGTRLRALVIDIETRPIQAFVWSLHGEQHISPAQVIDPGGVICWAAKWVGDKAVEFRSDHHDGHEAMIRRAYELMHEADAIIGYNSASFDVKHLRGEFAVLGLNPPAPHKNIDLLPTVKQQFRFPSNKLDYVAQALELGGKVQHTGFDMWKKCLAGDVKAWALMKKYNVQDVNLTERLYLRILPWIKNHPHHGLYLAQHLPVCRNCGEIALDRDGHAYTPTSRYQRFQCRACGAWSRGTHTDRRMGTAGIAG